MSALRDLASRFWYLPNPVEPVRVHGDGPVFDGTRPLRVLSWNVQFGAGRNRWFFYDRGPDSRVTRGEVDATLEGIASVIRDVDPDLVFLQEVDRKSARTAWVDQHAWLASKLGLPVHASTPYFWVPFVPVPPKNPMGAVQMHLSVFSRFALSDGERVALSPLREPMARRIFNLRRALMQVSMPVAGARPLTLFQTHLSAFSLGDGTLARQVSTVLEHVDRAPGASLLVGDFNSLPPGDDPRRLGDAAALYEESTTPVQPLYDALDVLFPPTSPVNTYVPWGSMRADRTIDYAFGRELDAADVRVVAGAARWSDHLPVVLEIQSR